MALNFNFGKVQKPTNALTIKSGNNIFAGMTGISPVKTTPAVPFDATKTGITSNTMLKAKKPSALESVFSKLPTPIKTITTDIKEGLVGRGQEPDITGKTKFDTGLLGFFRPFGIGKPTEQKILDRSNLLQPLVQKGKITPQRADEIAKSVAQPKGLEAVQRGLPIEPKKVSLTSEEKKAIRPVVIEETLDKIFGALDVVSFGTMKPLTRTASQKIAKSTVASEIFDVLKKEIPDLADDAGRVFSDALRYIDNADDVQRVINKTNLALQEAKKVPPVEPTGLTPYIPVAERQATMGLQAPTMPPVASKPAIEAIPSSISKAKSSGQSFDEWVKGENKIAEFSPLDEINTKQSIKRLNDVGIPVKSGDEIITLYHGTNAKGVKGITESGSLNPFSYLATDKNASKNFVFGKGGDILEIKVPVRDAGFVMSPMANAKGVTIQNPIKLIKGEDGIWKVEKWKTRSQLKAEWDKEVKPSVILPKAEKPKLPTAKERITTQARKIDDTQLKKIAEDIKRKDLTTEEFDNLAQEISFMEQNIESNPVKELLKYSPTRGQYKGRLPEVLGKGTSLFARKGDTLVTELGFEDSEQARNAFEKWYDQRETLKKFKQQLTQLRKTKTAIKKGEALMTLARGERRTMYNTMLRAFNLTDAEVAKIRQGKDIMAMTDEEFKEFLRVSEGRAAQIAERSEAVVQLKGTIYEKELKKWENIQEAMKLPKLSEMSIDQIKKLDDFLSQYKTGDEFLPVRQIQTIDNTVLKGLRTTREVKEYLAKTYDLTPEQLPPIKPHPWMYDTQLARQHPFYDLLVDRYNESYLKAMGRVIELERENDKLVKLARKSRQQKLGEKIAPTDPKIVKWLEGDEAQRKLIEKEMTIAEIKAAEYQDKIYREYYDWLSKREVENKFSSRFQDKYFPHTRRSFLEAWKEDGFLKSLKEAFSQFKQEEKRLNILDEKTGEILPYQKWVKFSQFRTGGLVPTFNTARAFKSYITALEKARQFDEFIPEIMTYVHSLTPKGLTPSGLEMDDSLKRFVQSWVNAKKGRVEKQIIKPGSKADWALRMGVTLTRLRDLGLNIPVGIANIFGEQATDLTMLGSKNYSKGLARLTTKKGREIVNKYPEFVGKTFWESLSEASNTAGDKLLSGIYGLFGVSSRKGNEIFLLGSITPEEFSRGVISTQRLAQIRKQMGKYRVVEGAESIFGKSVEGAVTGQYKKWSIPILTSTASNLNTLQKMIRTRGIKTALSSKEGSELFYSIVLGSVLGLSTYGYYNELKEKDDRSFVEDIIFKVIRDSLSLIGALNPKFIGSFAAPRLSSFIIDLTEAINSVLLLDRYKTTGELKGIKQIKKTITPTVVSSLMGRETTKESKSVGGIDFALGDNEMELQGLNFNF